MDHSRRPFGSLLHVTLTAVVVFLIGLGVVRLWPIVRQRMELSSLSGRLRDPSPDVRKGAADRLGELGKPALPLLLDATNDSNPDVRVLACSALMKARPDPELAIRTLIKAIKDDQPIVRRAAAWELGIAQLNLGLEEGADETKATIDALRAALHDKDRDVRTAAVEALAALGRKAEPAGEDLVNALSDRDPRVRIAAARTLLRINHDSRHTVLPVLLSLVGDTNPESNVSQRAFGTLREEEAEEQTIPRLVELLQDKDAEARRRAATYLGDIGAQAISALYPLLESLGDEDATVRFRAAQAVAAIDPESTEPTIPVLKSSVLDPKLAFSLRSTAIDLLGAFDPESEAKVVPGLVRELHAKEQVERASAVFLLKQIGPQAWEALPALTEIWRNSKDVNSIHAGEAIQQINPSAFTRLR